jgi:hypothetical protein
LVLDNPVRICDTVVMETDTEELAFWRKMAEAAEDDPTYGGDVLSGLCALSWSLGDEDKDQIIYEACVSEGLEASKNDYFWSPYDWPPRRAFIQRQIARLEREIGELK